MFRDPDHKICPDLFDPETNARSKVKVYYPQNHKNAATLWSEGRDCLILCFRGFIGSPCYETIQFSPFLCRLRKVVEKIMRIKRFITTRWSDQTASFWKWLVSLILTFLAFTLSITCPWQVLTSTANISIISNSSKEPLTSTELFTCRNKFSLPKRWLDQVKILAILQPSALRGCRLPQNGNSFSYFIEKLAVSVRVDDQLNLIYAYSKSLNIAFPQITACCNLYISIFLWLFSPNKRCFTFCRTETKCE